MNKKNKNFPLQAYRKTTNLNYAQLETKACENTH